MTKSWQGLYGGGGGRGGEGQEGGEVFIIRSLSYSLSLQTEEKNIALKGHGNEYDFPRFLHKPVQHRSRTLYMSSRSDFGFEFAEIFVIKK